LALSPGDRLGAYEILSLLGAGGMGEVYRARDTKLNRDVAVKVLPQQLADHAPALERFEREAKAVAALSHPNILAIFDFGRERGTAYAVMELLDGETLRQRLAAPVPARKVVEYGAQIARGLAAAHDKGIVHRDLKPENVFVTTDGRVKILDFGLARQTAGVASGDASGAPTINRHTDPGTVLGTVGYMSPEQARGESGDHRADLFSLGALLYELVSGRRAFQRDTAPETLIAILREDPPALGSMSLTDIPPGLVRVIEHCLEKNPSERFQHASDVAFALENVTGTSTAQAPAVASLPVYRRCAYQKHGTRCVH
jgi:serine/threonine protein kinase